MKDLLERLRIVFDEFDLYERKYERGRLEYLKYDEGKHDGLHLAMLILKENFEDEYKVIFGDEDEDDRD